MAKRNWPDHPAIGRTIMDGDVPVKIVDVKVGPLMFDPSDLEKTDVTFIGTLKLRIKYPGGYEEWLPPTEAKPLLDWCERQDHQQNAAPVSERARELPESLRTEIFNAFDDITGLCRYLREGGPVDDDLNGLNEGLQEAIHIAGGMMARMIEPMCEPSPDDVKRRARELLAEAERGPQNDYGTVHRQIAHRAIEQALTQQRGEWTPLDIQTFARAYKAEVPGAELTVHGIDAGLHALARPTTPQPSADAVREVPEIAKTGTVADYSDDYLLGRAVRGIAKGRKRDGYSVAWARVSDAFALGSTYSKQLCLRFNVNPDTGDLLSAASGHQQNAAQGGGEK